MQFLVLGQLSDPLREARQEGDGNADLRGGFGQRRPEGFEFGRPFQVGDILQHEHRLVVFFLQREAGRQDLGFLSAPLGAKESGGERSRGEGCRRDVDELLKIIHLGNAVLLHDLAGLPVAPQNVMPLIGDHDGCGTDIENLNQNEALEYPLQGRLHLLDQALQLFDLDWREGVPETVLQIEDPENPVEQADGNAQFGADLFCNLDISLRLLAVVLAIPEDDAVAAPVAEAKNSLICRLRVPDRHWRSAARPKGLREQLDVSAQYIDLEDRHVLVLVEPRQLRDHLFGHVPHVLGMSDLLHEAADEFALHGFDDVEQAQKGLLEVELLQERAGSGIIDAFLFRNQAKAADDPAACAYRQAHEGSHARGDGCFCVGPFKIFRRCL